MNKREKYLMRSMIETANDNRSLAIEKAKANMNAGNLDELDRNLNKIKLLDEEISRLMCDLSAFTFEEDQLSLW